MQRCCGLEARDKYAPAFPHGATGHMLDCTPRDIPLHLWLACKMFLQLPAAKRIPHPITHYPIVTSQGDPHERTAHRSTQNRMLT